MQYILQISIDLMRTGCFTNVAHIDKFLMHCIARTRCFWSSCTCICWPHATAVGNKMFLILIIKMRIGCYWKFWICCCLFGLWINDLRENSNETSTEEFSPKLGQRMRIIWITIFKRIKNIANYKCWPQSQLIVLQKVADLGSHSSYST